MEFAKIFFLFSEDIFSAGEMSEKSGLKDEGVC